MSAPAQRSVQEIARECAWAFCKRQGLASGGEHLTCEILRAIAEAHAAAHAETVALLEECLLHLIVVLPMAKGYASANPVGNNWKMIEDASGFALNTEKRLAPLKEGAP